MNQNHRHETNIMSTTRRDLPDTTFDKKQRNFQGFY